MNDLLRSAIEKHSADTIAAHRDAVDFVVRHLAGRGVSSSSCHPEAA